ncbi:hypothetical protein BJP40_03920 [Streptomyces sp. CC53]|uniref:hypothetical protein n=1 Tax=Streptomyces sp. CC53 TaxID=1906740 RepID=UPI0008DCC02E|nr:hypothetical protein [Streptomyces sp. CC53]OII62156.1 hypothetical protein BJP40_03920 [Streptomyces sp. CC53]
MSVRRKPSSQDDRLAELFGARVNQLYRTARADARLRRALELRSFLALTEEQVARVRDRVHARTAPDRSMDELSEEELRMDAEWMKAALSARRDYLAALDEVLRAEPSPEPARPVTFTQPVITARTVPTPGDTTAHPARGL